jgi:Raf kinase inhibitor-like YbhB/YbcL family protein
VCAVLTMNRYDLPSRRGFALLGIVLLAGLFGCRRHELGDAPMTITLTSTAFVAGAPIPQKYTGDADDLSPPLAWDHVPDGTKEFALICDDPDAPTPQPWVHWLLYKIPAELRSLPEGVPAKPTLDSPAGALQGHNSWTSGSQFGYRGPAPPKGHGTHHYHFKLVALDARLDLPPQADKRALVAAIDGHMLAQGELVGTYER